jgi:hypothetical protein
LGTAAKSVGCLLAHVSAHTAARICQESTETYREEEEKAENAQKEKKWKSIKETNSKGKIKSKKINSAAANNIKKSRRETHKVINEKHRTYADCDYYSLSD